MPLTPPVVQMDGVDEPNVIGIVDGGDVGLELLALTMTSGWPTADAGRRRREGDRLVRLGDRERALHRRRRGVDRIAGLTRGDRAAAEAADRAPRLPATEHASARRVRHRQARAGGAYTAKAGSP